ncbi:DUF4097 family beta strand repeat-containing protein [Actinomadura flavalba]|uniref:DUF4097 family beta strand repeat-containing protein n=1 Tax=Actinomadura flavalba TaxID=1120938 RepID=UPI00036603E0|nr:DUF4097 family beta strand repeat-containing protein [Actinomadura flavalba]
MRPTTAAALAAVLALPLTGCGVSFGATRAEESRTYEFTQPLTRLDAETGSGHVDVVAADVRAVKVTERLRFSERRRPTTRREVSGGVLRLRHSCPSGFSIGVNTCEVNYRVEVPRALAVRVRAGSGDVRLTGLTGPVDARAGSGDVRVGDLRGAATLRTGSGTVTGRNLTGGTGPYRARAGSGDVDLVFTAPPAALDVEAGSGDVRVGLPGDRPYRVATEAGSGSIDVKVTRKDSAAHTVTAKTGSGDITITPR